MTANLRIFVTRVLLPLRWKSSQQHAALTMKRFSEVEADSAWQYMNAMQFAESSDLRLMLFKNVLEEFSHSDAFVEVSHELAQNRLSGTPGARVAMMKSSRDMPYFLAFAHESERSIAAQFKGYATACGDSASAARVFNAISDDELEHEREARASLTVLIGSKRRVQYLIFRVRLNKAFAAWLRGSRYIGDVVSTIWFGAIYLVFAPLMMNSCRKDSRAKRPYLSSSGKVETAVEMASFETSPGQQCAPTVEENNPKYVNARK